VPELRFPTPPLAEETVLLRPWRAADVPENLMAFSDPVVQRFSWSPATPHSEDDACGYFVDQGAGAAARRGSFTSPSLSPRMRTRCRAASPSPHQPRAGACRHRVLARSQARGRGVASSAVRLLAQWAFTELALARLELTWAGQRGPLRALRRAAGLSRRALCVPTCPTRSADGTA
jgi:Acetyltransferase (GNAT) domain